MNFRIAILNRVGRGQLGAHGRLVLEAAVQVNRHRKENAPEEQQAKMAVAWENLQEHKIV